MKLWLREQVSTAGRRICWLAVAATGVGAACAEVGTAPDVPAAIEMTPYPSPAVVIGDTLRDLSGVIAPIKALVRNVAGDVIATAPIRYLYADALRDSALAVDSITGIVRALRASTGDARLVARVGSSLQVIRVLIAATRPDSMDRGGAPDPAVFTTSLPDTGRSQATRNSTQAISVIVRHVEANGAGSLVNGWPVRFEIVAPANPTNDTTKAVYLVDDQGRASVLDTTDASGNAGRKVRVRATLFPVGTATDTVVVRASVTYKGRALAGSPILVRQPVKRGT
jgi:hypothetical protein